MPSSAWSDAWSDAWGDSWGTVGAAVAPVRGTGDAGPRRKPPLFIIHRPEPLPATQAPVRPKRRKVTRRAVEYAIAQPWAGLWTMPEAMKVLPDYVPVNFQIDGPSFETLVQAIALQLAEETERRMQEDEEDVLMLLLAA